MKVALILFAIALNGMLAISLDVNQHQRYRGRGKKGIKGYGSYGKYGGYGSYGHKGAQKYNIGWGKPYKHKYSYSHGKYGGYYGSGKQYHKRSYKKP